MRAITLRVLCEGQSEANFVRQVLKPHLDRIQVFAKPEPLTRVGFGTTGYDRFRRAIQADVGRSREHEFVTTMIDLYKLGRYPGNEIRQGESLYDRVRRIEHEMASGLPNKRFIPYIQLHEFEALVFVDLDRLPSQFPDGEAKHAPANLRKAVGDTEPEQIDDGEQTAPSRRIIAEVPAYAHLKAVAGPQIASEIGLPGLRAVCPHLSEWVARLEALSEGR